MAIKNNVMIVRQRLLTRLIQLWNEDQLVENIDRLPIELSPRKGNVMGRCCIHKERAVWKYKALPLMGFDMSDEEDELTPLSQYAQKALTRQSPKDNIMCVVDEACSSCVRTNYSNHKSLSWLCSSCLFTQLPQRCHRI